MGIKVRLLVSAQKVRRARIRQQRVQASSSPRVCLRLLVDASQPSLERKTQCKFLSHRFGGLLEGFTSPHPTLTSKRRSANVVFAVGRRRTLYALKSTLLNATTNTSVCIAQ